MASPPSTPRGVLLDLDDVLVPWNTPSHWQWAWRPQGPKLGDRHVRSAIRRELRAWDRRRWRGLVGTDPIPDGSARHAHLRATLHAIAGHPLPDQETEAVLARFDRPAGEIETFDDALAGLRGLRDGGIPFAVVTELPEAVARWALRRTGYGDAPLARSGDDPVDQRLPSKAGFRNACSSLAVPPTHVVYVGDLFWSDVRAAARAGLSACLLDRFGRFEGVEARRISTLAALHEIRPESEPSAGERPDSSASEAPPPGTQAPND